MDFDEIPYQWRQPATLLEIKPNYANKGLFDWPEQALIIGQKLASGSIEIGKIVEVTRWQDGIGLFGRGSVGAKMVEAYRKANKTSPLFVMALGDAAGAVKATGAFTFAGAMSTSVVLRFRIAGRQLRMTALASDTLATLATKLAAAINADADAEVTATAADAVVTCTARHGGEVGNEIDLRVDTTAQVLPAGLTITVADMAGGTGNPDLQAALDVIANTWFTTIGVPWADSTNVGVFALWLKDRYTATARRDAHGFVFTHGTYGQLSAFGQLTNCPQLTVGGMKGMMEPAYVLAASTMGVWSFHRTNDPARQLRSLVVPNVTAPDAVDQFTDEEKNLLLYRGISTFECLADDTVTIARLITTYKQSNLGVDDDAWLDIMVPATMSRIRYDFAAYVAVMYPRAKLVDDDSMAAFATTGTASGDSASSAVVSPGRMHASWAARCKLYGEKVWIMDTATTVKQSVFAISSNDKNRLESRQQVKIVGNLMVLAGSLEFQV